MQILHKSRTAKIILVGALITLLVAGIFLYVTKMTAYHTQSTRCNGARCSNVDHRIMEHSAMSVSPLYGKTGDDFDKAFLEEMIVHHKGAIDMAYMLKATSKRPELLQLADEIVVAQTKEISQMELWLSTWFK